MNTVRWWCAVVVAGLVLAPVARAQQPPKPGPEHDMLKKMEGTWDATMKMGGMESKGTMVYKMDLGGLWLTSAFEGEVLGTKFFGKGLDTYDAGKKKYIGIWADSMSTSPMVSEGTYDAEKKALTMTGEGPGPDGKPAKHTMVTVQKDDDTMVMDMFMGDSKESMFTITFKRKK
ncbi:MAG TPA: DUF1579 domain-containing protein [Gemmataceae bacterium]|nr:DUF1579 domain-containing protein [Gemmataceae bacterium]